MIAYRVLKVQNMTKITTKVFLHFKTTCIVFRTFNLTRINNLVKKNFEKFL